MAGRRVSIATIVAGCLILSPGATGGQPEVRPNVRAVRATAADRHTLYAAPGDLNYAYGPKGLELAKLRAGNVDAASISVEYTGFSAEAQAAFQAAVDIWAATITTPVPIRIRASWEPLGSAVLGRAGPTGVCSRWDDGEVTFYPVALADKLSGSNECATLLGVTAEIEAEFNSTFSQWDFGTSGTGVANQYNFMTVALHEIAHGLGFFGYFESNAGIGALWGDPSIYDRFAVTGSGDSLLDFESPSPELHSQLTSNNTFFDGADATARNGGDRPKLETHYFEDGDSGWSEESSYSHVDDQLYSGTANGLMTYALNSNEVYTDVGPILKGILDDEGWTVSPLPGSVTLLAPSGSIDSTTPSFSFTGLTDATRYHVAVSPLGGDPVIDQDFDALAICSGTTCTLPSPVTLSRNTSYQWRVRAGNGSGDGPWSLSMSFAIPPPPPGSTVVTAPTGTSVDLLPTYQWNAVPGATWYYLWVTPQGSAPRIQTWYTAASVCSGATCQVTPLTVLSAATNHTVWVQTWNASGYGPWSAPRTFSTVMPTTTPVLGLPLGTLDNPAPLYWWTAVPGATSYYLWVQRNGSTPIIQTVYPAAAVCAGVACSVAPTTELPDGTYTWWVRAISSAGAGPWSTPRTFAMTAPVPTAGVGVWPLAGVHGARRPTYRWNRVSSATFYVLWVDAGPGQAPIVNTAYMATDVCGASVCSASPNVLLTAGGSYRWYIRPASSRGYAPWNAATTFSIATTGPPAASLDAPTGAGASVSPTYSWNLVPSASWYYLWVQPVGSGPLIQRWYKAEDVCGATTCSVNPGVNLAAQSYSWWIQTYNDIAYGPWSAARSFSR